MMRNGLPAVGLIGAGAMGGALLKGWVTTGAVDIGRSAMFDPAPTDALRRSPPVALNPPIESLAVDILVIAVKPQAAATALPPFANIAARATALSIMAGCSVASVRGLLGGAAKVARAMPNLPASIGKGVSGLYAPAPIDDAGRARLQSLLAAVGEVVSVDSEADLDMVTAVSGSGPAYFFLLAEALAAAGAAQGLKPADAERLARWTLIGAGALIEGDDRSAAGLRAAVTSPGGTTQAALGVLDGGDGALRRLIEAAVAAAARRAAELTG